MTDLQTPQFSTLSEGMDSTPETIRLLETMMRSIQIAVRKTLDPGGKFDLSNPDLTLDAIALRRKLDIDSVRTILRTQFYLAVAINDPTQDPIFCIQKIIESGDALAINKAYDYFDYKTPGWKVLYDALIASGRYNKAFENLPTGSKESIFVAEKIVNTRDPNLIFEAFELAERSSAEETILGEGLITTQSVDEIIQAFELVYTGTDLSIKFAKTIKQLGSTEQIERAIALSDQVTPEYEILAND